MRGSRRARACVRPPDAAQATAGVGGRTRRFAVWGERAVRDLSVGSAFAPWSRAERLPKGVEEPWRVHAPAAG